MTNTGILPCARTRMRTDDAAGRPNFETPPHPKNLYVAKTETPPENPPKIKGSLKIQGRGRGQGCRRGGADS